MGGGVGWAHTRGPRLWPPSRAAEPGRAAAAQIDSSSAVAANSLSKDLDAERLARTPAEMAAEAQALRAVCAGCGWADTYVGDS